MNELPAGYLMPAADGPKEGLPVWIFYIIFCAVLLLLFLAFLHNKDLRNKINNIFLAYKKKFMKFWLEAFLRRQEKKKNKLLIQLGQQGTSAWPELKDLSQAASELNSLEEMKEKFGEAGCELARSQLEPSYQAIGLIINKIRPEIKALAIYYSRIDQTERRIKILKKELEKG
ncbi:MAG: hypothetical protein KBC18_03005 [Candidatus Saccharicenans sp.]|nr:hypothetical protein [Candidatus Saccharicenans sp.]